MRLLAKSDVITLDQLVERLGMFRSTASGETITAETALRSPTVFAIVDLARRTIGQLPVDVVKVRAGKRKPQPDHPAARILNRRPNNWQSPFDFKASIPVRLFLHGNWYAQRAANAAGEVVNLNPLNPAGVRVTQGDDLRVSYEVVDPRGTRVLDATKIVHVRGLSKDDVVGTAPIVEVREAIAVEIAAEKFGAGFFGGGAFPSGIIEHPTKFANEEAAAKFRTTWQEAFGRLFRRGAERKTAVLEGGMKFTPLQLNNEESQFLETRKHQREVIAGAFGVPPHMIGSLEKATYNNVEQQSLEFVIYWLTPMLVSIEQALAAALFTEAERDTHQLKFNVDALLRGDRKGRQDALHIMRNDGIINANEWRRLEDMDPIDGEAGEAYLIQGAMAPVETIIDPPEPAKQPVLPENSPPNDPAGDVSGDNSAVSDAPIPPKKSEQPTLRVA